jgi:hypothetical protein
MVPSAGYIVLLAAIVVPIAIAAVTLKKDAIEQYLGHVFSSLLYTANKLS